MHLNKKSAENDAAGVALAALKQKEEEEKQALEQLKKEAPVAPVVTSEEPEKINANKPTAKAE